GDLLMYRGDRRAHAHDCTYQLDVAKHDAQVPGDRDLLDRVGELPVLDPQTDGAPRVVTRDGIHAEADELGHVEALAHRRDDSLGRMRPGFDEEVRRGRARHIAHTARRVPGRPETEPPRRAGIEAAGGE